jgi:KilA domain-containing protein
MNGMDDSRAGPSNTRSCGPHLIKALQKDGITVEVREADGYINSTKMAKAGGKEWSDWYRLANTKLFLAELKDSLQNNRGINRGPGEEPGEEQLVVSVTTGPILSRGTWVHHRVAIKFATWISAKFAVAVTELVSMYLQSARPFIEQPSSNEQQVIASPVTKVKKGPYDPTTFMYVRGHCKLTSKLQQAMSTRAQSNIVILTQELVKLGIADELTTRDRHRDYALDHGNFKYALQIPDRKKAIHLENVFRRLWEPMVYDGKYEFFFSDPLGQYLCLPTGGEYYDQIIRAMFGFMVRQAHTFYPEIKSMPFPFGKKYTPRLLPSVKAQLITSGKGKAAANIEEDDADIADGSMHQIVYDEQVLTMEDLPEYTALFPAPAATHVSVEEEATKRHVASEQARKEVEIAKVNAEYQFRQAQVDVYRSLFERGKLSFEQFHSMMTTSQAPSSTPAQLDRNIDTLSDSVEPSFDEGQDDQQDAQSPIPEFLYEFIDKWLIPGKPDEIIPRQSVVDQYLNWSYYHPEKVTARQEGFKHFTAAMTTRGFTTFISNGKDMLIKKRCNGKTQPVYTKVKWRPGASFKDTGPNPSDLGPSRERQFLVEYIQKTTSCKDILLSSEVERRYTLWLAEKKGVTSSTNDTYALRDALVKCKMGSYWKGRALTSMSYKNQAAPCYRFIKWKSEAIPR